MNVTLPNVPASVLAKRVIATLRKQGHVAYLAGGCVRDLLLHKTPKDYDVATSALPGEIEAAFKKTVAVGKSFGVITVIGDSDAVQVEVATFRHDGPYSDGRHPDSVRFTNAEEDALRRDFTINALFLDPESGEVVDYVNGVADLNAHVIRAVGDPAVRFNEDKLRLLRAIRFSCALNFEIDDETLDAVKRMAPQVNVCSKERIREELNKMLASIGRGRALRLLHETVLLHAVLPEIDALPAEKLANAAAALDLLTNPPPLSLSWAVLLFDVPDQAKEILTRLRANNELIARVSATLADAQSLVELERATLAAQKRLLRKPGIEEDLELCRVRAVLGVVDAKASTYASRRHEEFKRAGKETLWPKVPLNGDDLINLGIPKGPRYKEILTALEDEVLEGRVKTREAAIAFVKSLA